MEMRVQAGNAGLGLGLLLAAGTAIGGQVAPAAADALPPTDQSPAASRGEPDDVQLRARPQDRRGPAVGPGEVGPVEPIGPEIDTGVHAPLDFTIGSHTPTEVALRWWNQGAPQTKVFRNINGGAWSVIQTFDQLPEGAYVDFHDLEAAANTENCYRISASDGVNPYTAKTTPLRCMITRDGRDLPVHRLQLRLYVANVANAGSDEPLEVRLQFPSWVVPTATNWRPAGNSTWIDSTADDFERASSLTYDLMLTNVAEVSDITQVTLASPGNDQLCVAGLELFVDGQPAFRKSFGNDAATCAWVGGSNALSVDFAELRNDPSWNQLGVVTFVGFDGEALRSIIQAQFGHFLHGKGELQNGSALTTSRVDESRLKVSVPLTVYDVPVLGDVDSRVDFDMVLAPTGQLSFENVDASSSDLLGYFLPIIGWKILYETSQRIESMLGDVRLPGGTASPVANTHPCFTADGGISVCFDQ